MASEYKEAGQGWKARRVAAGLSVAQAAIRTGLSAATIANIEHGAQPGSAKTHRLLDRCYAGGEPPPPAAAGGVTEDPAPYDCGAAAAPPRRCHVYGYANCLTAGAHLGDVIPEHSDNLEEVNVPPALVRRRRIAAFRAVDTSMQGPDPAVSIAPGDLLFIDPDAELYDGAIALVKLDDEVLCKLWCRQGEDVQLASYSPGIAPRRVPGRSIAWAYRVVYVQPGGRAV